LERWVVCIKKSDKENMCVKVIDKNGIMQDCKHMLWYEDTKWQVDVVFMAVPSLPLCLVFLLLIFGLRVNILILISLIFLVFVNLDLSYSTHVLIWISFKRLNEKVDCAIIWGKLWFLSWTCISMMLNVYFIFFE